MASSSANSLAQHRPWRPFPWCLLPDWMWFIHGALILLFVSIPLVSQILSTIPTLKLLQVCYYNLTRFKVIVNFLREVKNRAARWVAERIMLAPRNADYLPWLLTCSLMPPTLLWFAWQRHRVHGFELTTMLIYHHLRIGPRFRFFAHHHVLVHKEGHSWHGFFKGPWKIFNQLSGMWTGLFFGTIPFHYRAAHVKIHHRWHNDSDDVHTNIDFDRTSFSSYIFWLPRFFYYWTGASPLAMFLKRKEYRLATELAKGMAFYYGTGLLLCILVDWKFSVAYWLYPHFESLTFLGMIAYVWHAFVEPDDPENQYINSVTILNGGDNIWNEDYHVVHHHYPNVHWSDAVKQYETEKEKYATVHATIFRDCEQGMLIHWMFSENWDAMAEHFVDLNGKLTHKEKVELILRRLRFKKTGEHWSDVKQMWAGWGASAQRNWDAGKTKDD